LKIGSPFTIVPAGACKAKPPTATLSAELTERMFPLSGPAGHLSQRERQDIVLFPKTYTFLNKEYYQPDPRKKSLPAGREGLLLSNLMP